MAQDRDDAVIMQAQQCGVIEWHGIGHRHGFIRFQCFRHFWRGAIEQNIKKNVRKVFSSGCCFVSVSGPNVKKLFGVFLSMFIYVFCIAMNVINRETQRKVMKYVLIERNVSRLIASDYSKGWAAYNKNNNPFYLISLWYCTVLVWALIGSWRIETIFGLFSAIEEL